MEESILKNKVILIVDDYTINVEVISNLVSNTGAIALTASNGAECLAIINAHHIDMILMDCHMPVMDGMEATRAIRSVPQGKHVTIIGITGSEDGGNTDACHRAGMNLVIDKLVLNEEKLIELGNVFFGVSSGTARQPYSGFSIISQSETEVNHDAVAAVIMDYKKALKEFDNDNELLTSLIREFINIVNTQLGTMRQALDRADFDCIRKESHGIKGGAANLCALPLAEAAKAVERACRQDKSEKIIADLIEDLDKTFGRFVTYTHTKTVI